MDTSVQLGSSLKNYSISIHLTIFALPLASLGPLSRHGNNFSIAIMQRSPLSPRHTITWVREMGPSFFTHTKLGEGRKTFTVRGGT